MNPNMQPMPHHPGEAARVVYNNTPAPMSPNDLVNQMGRLSVHPDRFVPGNGQRISDFDAGKPVYLGFTFFKADAIPGNKPTWKNIDRTKMNLSQEALSKLAQKGGKKLSVTNQYKSLSKLKRSHVDHLIEEFEQSNPQFDWTCVYVKEERFDAEGGYETSSMDVIIIGRPVTRPNPRVRVFDERAPVQQLHSQVPSQIDVHMPANDPRPFPNNGLENDPWNGPSFQQGPQHPAHPQHSHHPQPHHPQHPHPQQHPQHIHHALQPAPQIHQHGHPPHHPGQHMGGQQPPNQEPWIPGVPVNGPQPHPQVMHNHMGGSPDHNPRPVFPDNGMRAVPVGPGAHQGPGFHQNPQSHLHQSNINHKRGKSPFRAPESEPELVHEMSGSSEDESFDQEDLDTEAAHHSEDSADYEKHRYRGSLHHHNSSPRSKRPNPRLRTHYRRQSQKTGRPRVSAEQIEMYPADSRHKGKRFAKEYRYQQDKTRRSWDQPKIIHSHGSVDDSDILYLEPPRGGRTQSDIRDKVRSLYERESELEEWEKMIDHKNRVLNETIMASRMMGGRMDDAGYLGRNRPIWDRRGYGLAGLLN